MQLEFVKLKNYTICQHSMTRFNRLHKNKLAEKLNFQFERSAYWKIKNLTSSLRYRKRVVAENTIRN